MFISEASKNYLKKNFSFLKLRIEISPLIDSFNKVKTGLLVLDSILLSCLALDIEIDLK